MKKIALLLIPVLSLSCSKLDELTKFDMPYQVDITISSATNLDLPIDILTPPITSNSESTFAVNDTRKDLIEQIILTELDLEVIIPNGEDFSFLKSVTVYINADGLSELEIADSGAISSSVGSILSLTTVDNNLMEYIKKNDFSLKVTVVTDEVIVEDYEIEVNANFFVDAKILGL